MKKQIKQPKKTFMTSVNEIMKHLQKGKKIQIQTAWNSQPTTLSTSVWTGSWKGYGQTRLHSENYGVGTSSFTKRNLINDIRIAQATRDPKDPNKLVDSRSRKPVEYKIVK